MLFTFPYRKRKSTEVFLPEKEVKEPQIITNFIPFLKDNLSKHQSICNILKLRTQTGVIWLTTIAKICSISCLIN